MNSQVAKGRVAGFSLIELMIVVAIVGMLASIAVPNFFRFTMKSKTAEAKANIAAIRTAETSYHATSGVYVAAPVSPVAHGGSNPQTFVATGPSNAGFELLGWQPEGHVFFNYAVNSSAGGAGAYTIDASADLDANGTNQVWGYVHPARNGAIIPGLLGCTGTWDGASESATMVVGPCAREYGNSEF